MCDRDDSDAESFDCLVEKFDRSVKRSGLNFFPTQWSLLPNLAQVLNIIVKYVVLVRKVPLTMLKK